MGATELTDKICRAAEQPPAGNRVYYDTRVRGFGLRVTKAGAKSFVLNYRTASGVERRHTIGAYPEISLVNARKRASDLKDQIRHQGADPVGDRSADREAPTVADLCQRFLEQHVSKKRSGTQLEYTAAIEKAILPAWRNRKVDEIRFSDVEALHREITKNGTRGTRAAPYRANRVLAVLSKMFRLAKRWRWVTELPTEGIERNPESKRYRYLNRDELDALQQALRDYPKTGRKDDQKRRQTAVSIVRLLLLTGARRGEVCSMRWRDLDLRKGLWVKPSSQTKQKREHHVPISGPARQLLADIRAQHKVRPADDEPVFPGRGTDAPQITIKKAWAAIRQRATILLFAADPKSRAGVLVRQLRKSLRRDPTLSEIDAAAAAGKISLPVGLRDLRLHDLRHSYASFLVNEGHGLPTIGALLGHTQAQTTHRYAHLFDDPLRKATDRVGEIISGRSAEGVVVDLRQGRR